MSPYTLPDSLLEQFLADDSPWGDATTWGLGIGELPGTMTFTARHPQVVCCSEEALRMGALLGLTRSGDTWVASGTRVAAGTPLFALSGRAADLHRAWKPAQTLMEYAGGIATATADLVAAARAGSPSVAVACTRKHLPGSKAMAVKAVLAGGASPHRLGLSDTLLIFAEHRRFLGALSPAEAVAQLHREWPERQVVVEVSEEDEAAVWMDAGADVIQLEKCTPEVVARVVARGGNGAQALSGQGRSRPLVAAAGGVNPTNAEAYARAGAQILVSSAPYQGAPRDIAVKLGPVQA